MTYPNKDTEPCQIICFGTSFRTAPQGFREKVYLNEKALAHTLPLAKLHFDLEEILVLSTCNRFEIYAVCSANLSPTDCIHLLNSMLLAAGQTPLELTSDTLACTYYYLDQMAVQHFFRVTASLDSLIVGETQITGQVKKFLTLALQAKTLGRFLSRLGQDALALTKKIRSETAIGQRTVSISHAAVDLATRVFKDLSNQRILFVGAGEMSRLAAKYSLRYRPSEIMIANRSVERARALANELGTGTVYSLDQLPLALSRAHVVICATNAAHPIIDPILLSPILKQRRGQTLFICDIAMPRNVDSRCGDFEDVYLFEIDDLQKLVQENAEERFLESQKALQWVEQKVEKYFTWLDRSASTAVLDNIRSHVQDLCERELSKTLGNSKLRHLDPEQRQVLSRWSDSVAAKLVSDIASRLNSPELAFCRSELQQALEMAFPEPPKPLSLPELNLGLSL